MRNPQFLGTNKNLALYKSRDKSVLVNTKTLTAAVIPMEEARKKEFSKTHQEDPTWSEIAAAALTRETTPKVLSMSHSLGRTYTVPRKVLDNAKSSFTIEGERSKIAEHVATLLSSGNQISCKDVLWLSRFFGTHDSETTPRKTWMSWGGSDAQRWSESLSTRLDYDSVVADAGTYDTPGVQVFVDGTDEDRRFWTELDEPLGQYAISLFMQTPQNTWQAWGNGDWIECDQPTVSDRFIEVDDECALYVAGALFDSPDTHIDLRTPNPEAWDLAVRSRDDVDWTIVDRATITAAVEDENYTPDDRSDNAAQQLRDANGRFAEVGASGAIKSTGVGGTIQAADPETNTVVIAGEDGESYEILATEFEVGVAPHPKPDPEKAKDSDIDLTGILAPEKEKPLPRANLPEAPENVYGPVEVKETISSYSKKVNKKRQERSKDFDELLEKQETIEDAIVSAAENNEEETTQSPRDDDPTPEETDVDPIYFAIVAKDDPRAVMELIAMVPASSTSTEPKTFRRSGGSWIEDHSVLEDLRSATPPPVVQLNEEQYQNVIAQVDTETGDLEEGEGIPAESQSVTAAGGLDRNRGNAEDLRRYWTVGPGGLKIRWNTGGDWTRCVRLLSKHLGPRAKGYCFSGDTEFITKDGIKTFEEVVGTTQLVLTQKDPSLGNKASSVRKDGHWVEAPIRSYGEQRVLEVTLTRRGAEKKIKATPEHVWFASKDSKSASRLTASSVRTDELVEGMTIAALLPKESTSRSTPSPVGVASGIVFGDGYSETTTGAKVDLWGEKDSHLLKYFELNEKSKRKTENGVEGWRIYGLPNSWKNRPSLDEGHSYLFGWLAGYIAADGTVSKNLGTVSLSSASKGNLEFAALVALRLGISTYPITETSRLGYGEKESSLFKMSFVASTVPRSLLVLPKHRERFDSASKSFDYLRWRVKSVEDHGEVQEVFCAEVPNTETFALKDYLWVHNCALRHKETTGMWPGDRRNRQGSGFALTAGGGLTYSDQDLKTLPAVLRASVDVATSAEAAIQRVRGFDYSPTPPSVEDIHEGRSGRAFIIPIAALEGLPSGDGRIFGKGALGIRNLPVPLLWQIKTADGHDGSVIVGRIDRVERTKDGLGNAYGVFDTGPFGQEAQRLVENNMLRWVSVDLDKFEMDEGRSDEELGRKFISKGRLMAVTLVAKPAFQECNIELVPIEEEKMPDYETPSAISASASIASSIPVEPPSSWFENPHLNKPTPIHVDNNGRLFGHIATWDTDHIGMAGNTKAPRSSSNYAYFHTGVVRTSEGNDVKVGQLTLAGGHAPIHLDASAAVRHYDDTASAVADVHAGEDSHGIWVSGALRPGTTPDQIRSLRASAPSGDWRAINHRLELVAVCQVNVPGFPVPRTLAASGSAPTALVAAGTETLLRVRIEQTQEEKEALVASAKDRMFKALDIDGYMTQFKDFSPEKREDLAEKGWALDDGSFPIENVSDLRRAVQAYGRASESKRAKVRRHIAKRAKALDRADLIPSNWKESSMSEAAMAHRDRYDSLVASANRRRVEDLKVKVNKESILQELRARVQKND